MKIYYKKDISEILDRPLRTITQWLDSGFIVPDVEDSRGKGKPRIFSDRNIIEFAMFDFMSKIMGIQQLDIKYILDHLKGLETGGYSNHLNYDKIQDFYTNSQWGLSKELIYGFDISYNVITKKLNKKYGVFSIIRGKRIYVKDNLSYEYRVKQEMIIWTAPPLDDPDMEVDLFEATLNENPMVNKNVFWLGTIKNNAIKHFNITV